MPGLGGPGAVPRGLIPGAGESRAGWECESDKGDGWAGFWSGWFASEKHVHHPLVGRTPKVRSGSEGGRRPRPGGLGTLMACPERSVVAYACRQTL